MTISQLRRSREALEGAGSMQTLKIMCESARWYRVSLCGFVEPSMRTTYLSNTKSLGDKLFIENCCCENFNVQNNFNLSETGEGIYNVINKRNNY